MITSMLSVQLWESVGLGLIASHPTNILYSNQTGGLATLHPQLEGAYIPLVSEFVDQAAQLTAIFTGPPWGGACSNGIDEETARKIEAVLGESPGTQRLRVDRSRLAESHEAWVFVTMPADEHADAGMALWSGFPRRCGVLTWANSD